MRAYLGAVSLLGIAVAATLVCGCSGIRATKSVSPLDFLLPGIMQHAPPLPPVEGARHSAPMLVESGARGDAFDESAGAGCRPLEMGLCGGAVPSRSTTRPPSRPMPPTL